MRLIKQKMEELKKKIVNIKQTDQQDEIYNLCKQLDDMVEDYLNNHRKDLNQG